MNYKYIEVENSKHGIKSWCKDIEAKALEQAVNLTRLPFTFKHVALMPDCHVGYGMPIGGVLATQDVIIPNAVGVDIGCGVQALRTNLTGIDTGDLKKIMSEIRNRIPLGFNHHKEKIEWVGFDEAPDIPIIQKELQKAQQGDDGFIWIMLHSGSRNFGFKIAKDYHEKAKLLCEKWYSDIPNKDLAFLPLSDPLGIEYKETMEYALSFAHENRNRMMQEITESFIVETGCNLDWNNHFDIHHNYATLEHHYGKNVMIHRKGATRAFDGHIGIIPGSQGTSSYIVEGKANSDSFHSCSHGAGRKMGRKQAKNTLDLDAEISRLNEMGIIHSIRTVDELDEAPSAYKDIDVVMEAQNDLVNILVKLTPLGVIKG